MNSMNTRLEKLAELWVQPTSDSLRRISELCDEVAALFARRESIGEIDQGLLRRAKLLSTKAEKRVAECVAIQTRTGTYSTCGGHELSPRVVTSGWEG
jgi:hypothetical protein